MLRFMLTYNGFNGGTEYFETHEEAIERGKRLHEMGWVPDAIYMLNDDTGKYDILLGRFNITTKEA